MKNFTIWGLVIVILFGGGIWWSKSTQSKDPDVIARNGIHWHPELTIMVKNEKQEIPANIGIGPQYASNTSFDAGMEMTAIHTHDDANRGIIHFEFGGIVRKSDLTLGKFLAVWGKDINSFGLNPKMAVNGVENMELQDYVMHDKDIIILNYE